MAQTVMVSPEFNNTSAGGTRLYGKMVIGRL